MLSQISPAAVSVEYANQSSIRKYKATFGERSLQVPVSLELIQIPKLRHYKPKDCLGPL